MQHAASFLCGRDVHGVLPNQARRADAACCISTDSLWRLHRRPVSETLSRSKKSEDRSINESKRLREDWIGDARRPCTRTRRTHPTSSKRLVLGTTGIPYQSQFAIQPTPL